MQQKSAMETNVLLKFQIHEKRSVGNKLLLPYFRQFRSIMTIEIQCLIFILVRAVEPCYNLNLWVYSSMFECDTKLCKEVVVLRECTRSEQSWTPELFVP